MSTQAGAGAGAGAVYGDWPTRSVPHVDRLTVARERLADAIRLELAALDGGHRGKGRPWSKPGYDKIYCTLRIGGRLVVLDEATGRTARICDTVEEAKEWYEEKLLEVEAGDFDEKIKAKPPRRRKRQ